MKIIYKKILHPTKKIYILIFYFTGDKFITVLITFGNLFSLLFIFLNNFKCLFVAISIESKLFCTDF